jgi:hypothetical protein
LFDVDVRMTSRNLSAANINIDWAVFLDAPDKNRWLKNTLKTFALRRGRSTRKDNVASKKIPRVGRRATKYGPIGDGKWSQKWRKT